MHEINTTLDELLASFAPEDQRTADNETPTARTITSNLSSTKLRTINPERVAQGLVTLGQAVRIEINEADYGDGRRIELGGSNDTAQRFEEYLTTTDDDSIFTIIINITKDRLLNAFFDLRDTQFFCFFNQEILTTLLNEGIIAIENKYFQRHKRTVFFINGLDIQCGSKYFTLFPGTTTVLEIKNFLSSDITDEEWDFLDSRISQRRTETNWQAAPKIITPDVLYLHLEASQFHESLLIGKLNKLCLDSIACSLANYTEPYVSSDQTPIVDNGTWRIRFEGQKRVEILTPKSMEVTSETCGSWFHLYDWAYSTRYPTDTINIVRNLLTLHPTQNGDDNYNILIQCSKEIDNSSRSHYGRYVGESIEKYFSKVKESATFFQSKVDALSQQINGMIDAFLKNLLAVAGFIIGTLVAKLTDKTQVSALPTLLTVFIIYIIVSSFIYYFVSWRSYKLTESEYEKNKENAQRFFTPEDRERYIGDAFEKRKCLFLLTFKLTVVVYVLVLIASFIYALVPSIRPSDSATPGPIGSQQTPSPTPTRLATPIVSPTPKAIIPTSAPPQNGAANNGSQKP